MNIQGKIWGSTSLLFDKNNVEIHRIVCEKNGYSSKHKHISKYNMFFVEKGKLEISIWKKDYDLIDKTILGPQQFCIVDPGEYHMFKGIENNTIVFEIYWVEIDKRDIVRDNVGGKKELN